MKTQHIIEYDCFFCDVCRHYVYDEMMGDEAKGLAAEERVRLLPHSWHCPSCGVSKEQLLSVVMSPDLNADDSEDDLPHCSPDSLSGKIARSAAMI